MMSENIVKMNNEVYILGRLATGEEYYPNMVEDNRQVVCKMNNSSNIAFFVEALSDEPKYSKNILNKDILSEEDRKFYIGIDWQHFKTLSPIIGRSDLKKYDYRMLSSYDKENLIYDKLEGKLIIFKINIIKDNNNNYRKNLILESILDVDDDEKLHYKTIPDVQKSIEKFEKQLLERETIHFKGYTHDLPELEAVICDEYIYIFYMSDWEKVEGTLDGWKFIGKSDNIKKSKLNIKDEEYDKLVIRRQDAIAFIEENYFYENHENAFDFKDEVASDKEESFNRENKEKNDHSENNTCEADFIKQLKNYTMSKNLCYDIKDIVNLHVSIKTNPITIVAGMSGTGKTQISLAYAEVLGLNEKNKNLLFLPVSPSYTEPEDITGYLNTTTGLYVASETGLVDFLMHAQENKNKLHFIVFDEMNLSQVEHWFAPFISLLELNEKDRMLKLYSKNSVCHNKMQYNHAINIGDNIRFIGTVNLDETTKDFSDRLLDRSNLVSLKKRTLREFTQEKKEFNKEELRNNKYTYDEYLSWINNNVTVDEFLDEEIDLLDILHTLISSNDQQKGVSFRIAEKIISYIQNIPIDKKGELLLERGLAFDLEIKQRILTKLKGSERQMGELIGKIQSNEIVDSKLDELFNDINFKNVSDFKLTKEEIKRKARELTVYGYTN